MLKNLSTIVLVKFIKVSFLSEKIKPKQKNGKNTIILDNDKKSPIPLSNPIKHPKKQLIIKRKLNITQQRKIVLFYAVHYSTLFKKGNTQ